MLRHSAIAVSDNDDRQASTVSFEGDAWLDYVPIRLPGTINVEEKLPPTAAAVLINQAHTQTDIYLPITAAQKDWVDLIDGQKTVRDIVGAETNIGAAKTLFQRLWWYDQVVFDASLKSD
jgi:hypothetical protein